MRHRFDLSLEDVLALREALRQSAGLDGDVREGLDSRLAELERDIPMLCECIKLVDMIDDGIQDSPEGAALRAKVEAYFGSQHPEILDLDRFVWWRKFTRRVYEKREG